ncbi:hypothetical protein ACI01nite_25400 [Acetobacter cibinongensis]|uniref:Uncharacterized protein n=1 Tax=Acetobacter cibinongensis TaxID=146475 RepID=A0A0D6N7P8_9PROT|nr:hypothetical protein Abci_059_027 [Acetobacter cibinongensis]GEL59938.1 hypothetical protein ACI01nite_25400 [Acetobacter cibinongensis]
MVRYRRLAEHCLNDALRGSVFAIVDGTDGWGHNFCFDAIEVTSGSSLGSIIELPRLSWPYDP